MSAAPRLPGQHIAARDLTYRRIPLASAVVQLARFATALHHALENLADLGLVVARVVTTLHVQVADGHRVAVVLVGAGHAATNAFYAHVGDFQMTRAAVVGAVTARAPQLAKRGNVGILHHRSRT